MIITGSSGNVVNLLVDCDDLTVIKCALLSTDVSRFEVLIDELKQQSILSSELTYHSVPGQAIVTITHFEKSLEKFKQGEVYRKMLEEAEIKSPVN